MERFVLKICQILMCVSVCILLWEFNVMNSMHCDCDPTLEVVGESQGRQVLNCLSFCQLKTSLHLCFDNYSGLVFFN